MTNIEEELFKIVYEGRDEKGLSNEDLVNELLNWVSLHDADVIKQTQQALAPTWRERRNWIAESIEKNPRAAAAWEVKTGGINRVTDLAMMACFHPDTRHWKGDDQVKKALDELAAAYKEAVVKMTERLNW